ncbi:hypothetical protein APA73_27360 [Pseudomonas aeruginosa]|uniref:Uncharacterized protein n=2 Tax=Pseudomonas TaxID=286 RepID=A0ABD7JSB9_PSEAI|nr:hypothetical protein [Pseudomonas aeruginosa]ELO6136642.1 hypothetical protein [Escherichia coli]EZP10098.1 hypothetical protein V551_05089 [Pseudomonas aeruginosa BWH050]RTR88725.1 hypothetical protein DY932_33530 [Pseudomonas paraeruginosa]EKV0488505.1 hypothetical protein [Pseudomonas aeruginosa]
MAANLAWYAGQCVSKNDVNMTVKVVGIRSEDGWSLLDKPQKLFPKAGEVEVRLQAASGYHKNDWVIFQVAHKEPRGKWKASTHRKLTPFLDLQDIGSLDALRSCLTEEGVDGPDHSAGWVIRYSEDRIILLDLIRSPDNRYRMAVGDNFYVYVYEPELLHCMPSDTGEVFLYDCKRTGECLQVLDWAPDDGYIKRIVRAMAGAHDPSVEFVIEWLKRHADEATGQIGSSLEDKLVAQQSARSGELIKRLLADKSLLGQLTELLLADAKMLSHLQSEIQAIAEQERGAIRASLMDALEHEVMALREERLLAFEAELRSLEAEQHEVLRGQLEQDMKSNILAMEERVAARQTKLEDQLESRRTELQQGIDALAAQREALKGELESIGFQIKAGEQSLAELKAHETLVAEEIERLKDDAASIHVPKSVKLESVLRFNPPQCAPTLGVGDMHREIKESILLTSVGKERMTQFFALLLAGESPVLHGPETQDFLLAAEALLSSGRSMRLEADPTVITFEDLWLRAGTQLPTALTHGLELSCGQTPVTVLAIVERAERSGARFWLPALADRTRRGELPRRFFICATVEDEDCEEAQAIRSQVPWLHVSGTIAPSAPALVPMVFAPAKVWQLDPGERPQDITPAMTAVAPLVNQLTLVNALRLARAATEWVRLNQGVGYEQTPSALTGLFIDQRAQADRTQQKS